MNIKQSIVVSLFYLLLSTFTVQASTTLLENPPVKYFSNKQGLELNVVQDLLLDAIDRASFPDNVWSVEKLEPGEIIAKLVVRDKHIAYIKIQYDKFKIAVKYHDSQNLGYSRAGASAEIIHPNYLKWIDFLMSKIIYTTIRIGKTTLTNDTPQEVKLIASNTAYRVSVFAFGDKSRATVDKRITTSKKFSELLTNQMATVLNKLKTPTSIINPMPWSQITESFIFGDKQKTAKNLCATSKSDMLIGGAMGDEMGGQGYYREIKFISYNCDTKETNMVEKRIIDNHADKFPYQIEFSDVLLKFSEKNRIFNNIKSGFKTAAAQNNQTIIVSAYGDYSQETLQYGIKTLETMSKTLTNELKRYYNTIRGPGTNIVALEFGGESEKFLFGDKQSAGGILCDTHKAKFIVATILEPSGGGQSGFRDLKIYGYSCKERVLKQKQLRIIDAYDEKFAYQKQFTAAIKDFTSENKVLD